MLNSRSVRARGVIGTADAPDSEQVGDGEEVGCKDSEEGQESKRQGRNTTLATRSGRRQRVIKSIRFSIDILLYD